MYQRKFVDRERELQALENSYSAEGASFFVIYGRRRVGKTALISRFVKGRGIYFLATTEGDRVNIGNFQRTVSEFLGDESIKSGQFQDWFSLLTSIAANSTFQRRCKESKIVLAFDEFPYLIEGNRAIPSVFQKIYDTILNGANVMLLLSGSSISMMENEVLAYRSPLYGRRTGQMRLNPLGFRHVHEFVDFDIEDLCRTYFVFGGIPDYLIRIDLKHTFWENVSKLAVSKEGALYEEPEFLMRTEFREPRNYMLILRSIALGNHTLGEISSYASLDKSMVSKYMDILMSLGLVLPERPFGAPEKFKRRLYWISDQYLKFWFRYILPNRSEIEDFRSEDVMERINNDFNTFAGEQFENLMKELVIGGILGRTFSTASRWWGKNLSKKEGSNIEEIDIIAYSESRKEILFAECKWSNSPVSTKIIDELKMKSERILALFPDCIATYALFSKSGFKESVKSKIRNVEFMSLADIQNALYGHVGN